MAASATVMLCQKQLSVGQRLVLHEKVFGGEEILTKSCSHEVSQINKEAMPSKYQELDISLNGESQKQKFNRIF